MPSHEQILYFVRLLVTSYVRFWGFGCLSFLPATIRTVAFSAAGGASTRNNPNRCVFRCGWSLGPQQSEPLRFPLRVEPRPARVNSNENPVSAPTAIGLASTLPVITRTVLTPLSARMAKSPALPRSIEAGPLGFDREARLIFLWGGEVRVWALVLRLALVFLWGVCLVCHWGGEVRVWASALRLALVFLWGACLVCHWGGEVQVWALVLRLALVCR